jgi:hypothetical protein
VEVVRSIWWRKTVGVGTLLAHALFKGPIKEHARKSKIKEQPN